MKVIEQLSKPGIAANEDLIVIGSDWAVILDGATPLNKKTLATGENIAQWYVAEIAKSLVAHDHLEIKENLKVAIANVKQTLEQLGEVSADLADQPSASLAAIQVRDNVLNAYVLGDTPVFVELVGGETWILRDSSLSKLDKAVIDHMVRLSSELKISIQEARELPEIQQHLIENRRLKNTPEGYWTMGLEPEVIDQAVEQSWDTSEFSTVHMMSDGFTTLYEDWFNLGEPEPQLTANSHGFVNYVKRVGIDQAYEQLRALENVDSDFSRVPRFKKSDDASYLSIDIKG